MNPHGASAEVGVRIEEEVTAAIRMEVRVRIEEEVTTAIRMEVRVRIEEEVAVAVGAQVRVGVEVELTVAVGLEVRVGGERELRAIGGDEHDRMGIDGDGASTDEELDLLRGLDGVRARDLEPGALRRRRVRSTGLAIDHHVVLPLHVEEVVAVDGRRAVLVHGDGLVVIDGLAVGAVHGVGLVAVHRGGVVVLHQFIEVFFGLEIDLLRTREVFEAELVVAAGGG